MVSCLMGDSTALASAIVRCCLSIDEVKARGYNLDFKNPNRETGEEIIDIDEVLKGLESSFTNAQGILTKIKEVLSNND